MSYKRTSGCKFKELDAVGGGSVSHIPSACNEAMKEVGDAIHVNITG